MATHSGYAIQNGATQKPPDGFAAPSQAAAVLGTGSWQAKLSELLRLQKVKAWLSSQQAVTSIWSVGQPL